MDGFNGFGAGAPAGGFAGFGGIGAGVRGGADAAPPPRGAPLEMGGSSGGVFGTAFSQGLGGGVGSHAAQPHGHAAGAAGRAESWVVVSGFRPEDARGVRDLFDQCGVVAERTIADGNLWLRYASGTATALALAKNNTNVFGGVWVKVASGGAAGPGGAVGRAGAYPEPPRPYGVGGTAGTAGGGSGLGGAGAQHDAYGVGRGTAGASAAGAAATAGGRRGAAPSAGGASASGASSDAAAHIGFPQASLLTAHMDDDRPKEAIQFTPATRPPFDLRLSFLAKPAKAFANRQPSGVPIPEKLFEGQRVRFGVPLPQQATGPAP